MVLEGWPPGVLMPGQQRNAGARTKGIADLSQAKCCRLHQALIDSDIKITKVGGKDARSMWLSMFITLILNVIDCRCSYRLPLTCYHWRCASC